MAMSMIKILKANEVDNRMFSSFKYKAIDRCLIQKVLSNMNY